MDEKAVRKRKGKSDREATQRAKDKRWNMQMGKFAANEREVAGRTRSERASEGVGKNVDKRRINIEEK